MTIVLSESLSEMALEEPIKRCPVVIELPPKEPLNPKAVSWEYPGSEIGNVTRSGRCYAPNANEKGKKKVTEEEAAQVSAVIRTSEFEVIEQLRKLPAQISILDLFKSSEKHKEALLKVLGEIQVPETIEATRLADFVGTILRKDQITFSDEDFSKLGRAHNKALYISVKCSGKEVSHVLIDNGSAFNLCPLNTIRRLGKEKMIKPSRAMLKAYDGVQKEVVGDIELEVIIGPTLFLIEFQVADIPSAFNLLLGRPWIHMAGAIPSSHHQKVKFDVDGKSVSVYAESDFKAYAESSVPYVGPEEVEEFNYHSYELVNVIHAPEGSSFEVPTLSKPAIMSGRILLEHGYQPGKGLGRNAQGIIEPITAVSHMKRTGIGYHGESASSSSHHDQGRGRQSGRGGRMINPAIWKGKGSELPYHQIPLYYTFSGPPVMMQDEEVLSEDGDDLVALYEQSGVGAIISEIEDVPVIE